MTATEFIRNSISKNKIFDNFEIVEFHDSDLLFIKNFKIKFNCPSKQEISLDKLITFSEYLETTIKDESLSSLKSMSFNELHSL